MKLSAGQADMIRIKINRAIEARAFRTSEFFNRPLVSQLQNAMNSATL